MIKVIIEDEAGFPVVSFELEESAMVYLRLLQDYHADEDGTIRIRAFDDDDDEPQEIMLNRIAEQGKTEPGE